MSAKSRYAAVRPLPEGDAERLWEEGVYAALRFTAAVSALAFRPDGRWLLSGPLEELYGAKSTMAPCYGSVAGAAGRGREREGARAGEEAALSRPDLVPSIHLVTAPLVVRRRRS